MAFGLSETQKAHMRLKREIDALLAEFRGEVMCGELLGHVELSLEDAFGGKSVVWMVPGDRGCDLEVVVRVEQMICRTKLLMISGSAPR